jgi:nucleoside-diphosphate-sugar epimerase
MPIIWPSSVPEKRILLTGATGFIGRRVAQLLLADGHTLLVMSRQPAAQGPPELAGAKDVRWVVGDLSSVGSYREELVRFCPDIAVHLAWEGIPDFSFKRSVANLEGSLRLLHTLLEAGCERFVVAGTCLEAGHKLGPCQEATLGSAIDDFTWAKHALRQWAGLRTGGDGQPSLAWMRLFYVYGPGQRRGALIPTVLEALRTGSTPDIRTPHNRNDFVFVDDVAEALAAAAVRSGLSGTYNVGSGRSTSVGEMCRVAEQVVRGETAPVDTNRSAEVTPDVDFWAETARIDRDLDWQARTDLFSGIEATWHSMEAQR